MRRHRRPARPRSARSRNAPGRRAPAAAARPLVTQILKAELARRGVAVNNHLCEHFPYSRQQLFHLVRVGGLRTFERAAGQARPRAAAATSASPRSPRSSPPAGTSSCSTRDTGAAAGLQRLLPRQHPEGRHAIRSCRASPAARSRPQQLIAIGADRAEVRPLHQDHRRPAHRHARRPGASAAADLARAGRRRLRIRPRLRQGAAHGEELRRLDLVPLRRAGQCRPRDRARESLQGPALPAQDQVRRSPAARANAPKRRARTSASSPPRRAGISTSAATAA